MVSSIMISSPSRYQKLCSAIPFSRRPLLPTIQKYYESDEGKQAFAEWQAAQTADNKEKI